jgi:U3 small nucleolar ribonucleoprotein protein IMP4
MRNLTKSNVEPTTHIDSEYSRAGIIDPKIILTTSRDPSSKLLQFAKARKKYRIRFGPLLTRRLAGDALGFSQFI